MAAFENEKFSHSTMLFSTSEGNAMTFRMLPTTTRARLAPAIKVSCIIDEITIDFSM